MSRNLLLALSAITLISGCSTSKPTARSTVEQYLEAVKMGNTAQAEQLYCYPAGQSQSPITTLSEYSITTEAPAQKEGVAITEFAASVTRVGAIESRTDAVQLWVFETKDLEAYNEAINARFAALGVRPPASAGVPTTEPLCVFVPG